MSSEDSQDRLLQLLTSQNETLAKILGKQIDIMEKMREEQNARIEELAYSVKTLMENSNLNSEIVTLMKNQNETMNEVALAVKALEKNSKLDHDSKPFPTHSFKNHEPGWRAVFETLTVKMKDQVERWRNGMDSTLIFVALFVTVITAFQTPVSQNLSPNPADLTNNILGNLTTMVYEIVVLNGLKVPGGLPQPEPFRPDRTDQVVTLFWYTALLLSLITAMISVLGRQWIEHLTKKPDGQSYKDRSWRLVIREKLAENLLRPLLDSLHPILIVSIILFIVGLLFQLWFISFSASKPPVLILTSSLGSALIIGTAVVTVWALVHGMRREESPFTTSTSLAIRRRLAPRHIRAVSPAVKSADLFPLFCSAVKQMRKIHHFDQVSTVPFSNLLWPSDAEKIKLAVDTVVSVLESDASLKAKHTIAWNLCTSYWRIGKKEIREQSVDSHRRLSRALFHAEEDTPPSQEEVRWSFLIARMVVLLRFSGVEIFLSSLENKDLEKILLETFKLDPENCIDEEFLGDAKKEASFIYLRNVLEKEDPNLSERVDLSYTIEENVTKILDIVLTESLDENADCHNLINVLYLILLSCKLPFVFPLNFNISSFIKFATSDKRRFDEFPSIVRVEVLTSNNPVDVLLSCLTLMDESLLDTQQNLLEFLDSLNDNFHSIRDEIPLTPGSIIEVRNRVALAAMPLFWQWTS